jgi:hypothetical protein
MNFHPSLPIGQQASQIFTKLFEKGKVAACSFSKEICVNPINLLTNRKKGI